jgi:hypothetical protein
MRFNQPKAKLKTVVTAAAALLLGAGVAVAQQQVNLTAGATSIVLPDGSSVPMWGYSCGAAVGPPPRPHAQPRITQPPAGLQSSLLFPPARTCRSTSPTTSHSPMETPRPLL